MPVKYHYPNPNPRIRGVAPSQMFSLNIATSIEQRQFIGVVSCFLLASHEEELNIAPET